MTAPRPRWAAPRSNEIREQPCPTCGAPTYRALVEGFDIRADPAEIDVATELLAKLRGAWTFDVLRSWPGARTARLALRYPHHMPHRRHPIVTVHHCPDRPAPAPQPVPDRLF